MEYVCVCVCVCVVPIFVFWNSNKYLLTDLVLTYLDLTYSLEQNPS